MGEVKVKVRISNALDEALCRRGQLAPGQVRRAEVQAVVDTGAVRSVMPRPLMDQLGLMEQHRTLARYADGRADSVVFSEPATMEILGREVSENFLILGDEVLIGLTALEATDLLVDCNRQCVVPNPDHPNAPVIRIR